MKKRINREDNNNICKKRKITTPNANITPHFDYYPYSPVQSSRHQAVLLKWLSPEMIFNVEVIRNMILDYLTFSEENYPLFIFYGNDNYFKRRLKNINKTDAITIFQNSRKIESTLSYNFYFLLKFHALFKAMFGQHHFQELLQTPLSKENNNDDDDNEEIVIILHNDKMLTHHITNQKITQFFQRFKMPLSSICYFRFYLDCCDDSSIFADHPMTKFTLNTRKELTLYSCNMTINSNFHTHELLPSLREIKIQNNKNIIIHFDHDPNISTHFEFIANHHIFLKIKIPYQHLSVSFLPSALIEIDLFQKFPFKLQTEEIKFISKFTSSSNPMSQFELCYTKIYSIKKGIIQVLINGNMYLITLKNNSHFQCTGFIERNEHSILPKFVSFSTSDIPKHWEYINLAFSAETKYEIKWNTIPSNLNYFEIIGGTMIKTRNTSAINWSNIPGGFQFRQTSYFSDNPVRKFPFLCNTTIVETHRIKKEAYFEFDGIDTTKPIPLFPIQIKEFKKPIWYISYDISKLNEVDKYPQYCII